jgi:histidine ammonia-lyase
MSENSRSIVAFEMLAAVEGMNFRALRSNERLENIRSTISDRVATAANEWDFSLAVDEANELVSAGAVAAELPPIWDSPQP